MSKASVSTGKSGRKGNDNTKSSGNIVLNVTDIVVNAINNEKHNPENEKIKMKKGKREKINIGNIGSIESIGNTENTQNKSKEASIAETVSHETQETKVDTKIDNTLAVAVRPSTIPYIETPWSIIGAYFRNQHLKRLVRHQIESYNDFVT